MCDRDSSTSTATADHRVQLSTVESSVTPSTGPVSSVSVVLPIVLPQMEFLNKALSVAKHCNNFIFDCVKLRMCKPLIVDGFRVGVITPKVLQELGNFPDVFIITEEEVRLHDKLNTYESRSEILDVTLRTLKEKGAFVTLNGWRNECFEVRVDEEAPTLFKMERAATCLFGIRQFGVDITGFVKHPEKGLCVWLQQRSLTKQRWPGMWDNMVGGGLSVGYSVAETAHKEAFEEAGIPEDLLKNLTPAGTVSIFFESVRGLSPNTEFVYDLELPVDFVPQNQDGEVSGFHLFTAIEALEIALSPKFKTTSVPVILDFMLRHGVFQGGNVIEVENLRRLIHVPLADFYRKLHSSKRQD